MDATTLRQPLDAPGVAEIDGELLSRDDRDGGLQLEVIEHLRVRVPAAAQQAWLEAEQASWEPWLQRQHGFLGRQLRWDAEREEGQLLIRWSSRELWHAIPASELQQVQERFEQIAHAALERLGVLLPHSACREGAAADGAAAVSAAAIPALDANTAASSAEADPAALPNPFPLVYAGELSPDALP